MRFTFLFISVLPVTISAFNHPGLLVSDSDITRIKTKLEAKKEPWQASWNKLTSIALAQPSYQPNAVATVNRAENGENLWRDAGAAFNLGLRWKLADDEESAAACAKILTAWASTFKGFANTDDQYLTSGLQGYQLANAAELIRDYAPFAANGFTAVFTMLNDIFLRTSIYFLDHLPGSTHNVKHFHANWELSNVATIFAIGVLNDNQTAVDYALNYFKNGTGNGALNNAIPYTFPPTADEPNILGQIQESGRDQGHTALDMQLLGAIAQQAWNQGIDLFSMNDNRILSGCNYVAKYNLGFDVPFDTWTNNLVTFSEISPNSRGAYRPTWELFLAHYGVVKKSEGLNVTWVQDFRDFVLKGFKATYEGGSGSYGEGSGHYDGVGWGTLLYRLDDSDYVEVPTHASSGSATGTACHKLQHFRPRLCQQHPYTQHEHRNHFTNRARFV